MKKYMVIGGMSCTGCENRIKKALEKLDFVRLAEVDHEKGCAVVKMPVEVPDEVLKETVEGLGYEVVSIERLLCGCSKTSEAQVKALIESGVDTEEGIIEATGIGNYGCCSRAIIPLLIDKYKNGKDIDIQAAVYALNKKNDWIIAANDAKRQLKAAAAAQADASGDAAVTAAPEEEACSSCC